MQNFQFLANRFVLYKLLIIVFYHHIVLLAGYVSFSFSFFLCLVCLQLLFSSWLRGCNVGYSPDQASSGLSLDVLFLSICICDLISADIIQSIQLLFVRINYIAEEIIGSRWDGGLSLLVIGHEKKKIIIRTFGNL